MGREGSNWNGTNAVEHSAAAINEAATARHLYEEKMRHVLGAVSQEQQDFDHGFADPDGKAASVLQELQRAMNGPKPRSLFGQEVRDEAAFFHVVDRTSDGKVELQELRDGIKRLGMFIELEKLTAFCKMYDTDSTGRIDLVELARTCGWSRPSVSK